MPPGAWRSPRSGEEWVPDAWLLIGNCSADVIGGIAVAGACCSKIQKIISIKTSGLFLVFNFSVISGSGNLCERA